MNSKKLKRLKRYMKEYFSTFIILFRNQIAKDAKIAFYKWPSKYFSFYFQLSLPTVKFWGSKLYLGI
tara:strand:+ start:2920 stop:3120 length:201 start_codon:yes stop_codon:yes gene_type:complete